MTPIERQAVVEFISLTNNIAQEKQASIQSLQQELLKVSDGTQGAEKEASQDKILDGAAIDATVGNMIEAGWLKEAEAEGAKQSIADDPSLLLAFVDKLASEKVEATALPSLGEGTDKEASLPYGKGKAESDLHFERVFSGIASKL